nr:zinc ABC transporter substrate-binding protein [uncultured Carboxylicivirga sp.]
MKLRFNKYIYFLLTIFFFESCTTTSSNSDKPIISVSIGPQKYFVERLVDTLINVNVMIPQGASHTTYSPTAGQLVKLSHSEAYFLIGHLSFETTWKDKFESANSKMKWFNLSDGIETITEEHDHHHEEECSHGSDPHIWTSPKQTIQIVSNIKEALEELHPEYKSTIESNYKLLLSDIHNLDARLQQLQLIKPGLSFMIFHPAYTYLAESYGFEQLTIEFEGKTPTPSRMQKTIQQAVEKKVSTIYIQEEFDKTNAETIANSINAKTVQVNPLSENWLAEMDRFISHLENH